jgi:hypothetical protein
MKIFFEYIITKQNKEFREETKQDRKALRDDMEKQQTPKQILMIYDETIFVSLP